MTTDFVRNSAQKDQGKTEVSNNKDPKKEGGFFSELFRFALIAIVIVLPIRLFIAQPFIVSGSSMNPTFENGEYLIVDELSYRFAEPERGDVIIFRYPKEPSKFFIKRIIGLPGETVKITGGTVTISNISVSGLVLDEPYVKNISAGNAKEVLGSEEYFVLGDNRPASSDSRSWGPLERDLIIGRAFVRLLPVTKVDLFPGKSDMTLN